MKKLLLLVSVAFPLSAQPTTADLAEQLRRLKISGYVQPQYVHSERSADETTGAGGTRNLDQFSVRRGRIKFTYQATKTSRFVLQPDITSSGVTLKDAWLEA